MLWDSDGWKTCSACYETKSLDHYIARKDSRDGLEYRCNECRTKARKADWQRTRFPRRKV